MKLPKKLKKFLNVLGPGLTTGVSDDDPSGIATCSQAGAQFGNGQLWTPVFMLPLMYAVQEACGRIGACKAKGLAYLIYHHYSQKLAYFIVSLLLIANVINIGADIGSMAAATQLIFKVNFTVVALIYVFIILAGQILFNYKQYAKFLKWLCLFMLVYPLTAVVSYRGGWEVLKYTLVPHIEFNYQFFFILTGLFGTTISPYMFFWQASQEEEQDHARKLISRAGQIRMTPKYLQAMRLDTFAGMLSSQLISWTIIFVAATVLHTHGILDVKTAEDAAKALEPLVQSFPHSGLIAKTLFALGIIGLGLLAVPVLSGSAAYAVCEVLNLKEGLNLKFKTAKVFYSILIVATLVGILINYIGIDPIKALVYSAVINNIIALPMLVLIALISKNKTIMQDYHSGTLSTVFLWFTFLCMLFSTGLMIIGYFMGK